MKKQTYLIATLLILAVITLSGCGEQPKTKAEEPKETAVETAQVSLDELKVNDYITGTISPSQEVYIVPKISGKVERVAVKVGDRVKAGDLLVQLDTTEIAAQVKQAEAALAAAQGNISIAEANYNLAKDTYQRMEYLFGQGAISEQQYESAKSQLELAQAQLDSVKNGTVEQAKAALDLARTQLDNAVITAPSSGVVANVNVEPGELASPTSPVVTIVNLDTVIAEFNLTESQVGLVKKDMPLDVLIEAVSEEKFQGKVSEISPVANQATKAFTVKVAIPNKDHVIKAGMTAQIELTLDKVTDSLIVPVEAIMEQEGKNMIYVVENGIATLKEVEVILESETQAAVKGDLKAGDQVVVAGKEQLKDQAQVRVVNRGDE